MNLPRNKILVGDCLEVLRTLPDESVHCCVTSPPYWGLRDYGDSGQLGLEATPDEYVARMVEAFREVRRVLRDDGTLWLNLGDSYAAGGTGSPPSGKSTLGHGIDGSYRLGKSGRSAYLDALGDGRQRKLPTGLKPKDLVGIPWRVAFALQADGWYLRSDIIWCLSGGTRMYARTQKGDGPHMLKDLVRLDPSTVQLWNGERWTQVLAWTQSTSSDRPIEVVLRSGERIGCTPSHKWPTQRGVVIAADLRVGDVVQSCKLPEPDAPRSPAWLPDDQIGYLVGLYLAEGSRSGSGVLQLAGHRNETDARLARLLPVVDALDGSHGVYHGKGNGDSIVLRGPLLGAVIDRYIAGKTAKDKHLTAACWQRSNAFLRALFDGYLSGDGHYREDADRWVLGFTRNTHLANDLRTMAARLGWPLRIVPTHSTMDGRRFPSYRGHVRLRRTGHHNESDGGEIVRIGHSKARKLWDVTVADDVPLPQYQTEIGASPGPSHAPLFALASGVLTHNSKPNPMPESVTDRPTKAHEYLFLLTKRSRYFYDADAVRETADPASASRYAYGFKDKKSGTTKGMRQCGECQPRGDDVPSVALDQHPAGRNRRTVWTIATQPFPGAHFATFPPALVVPCILAGCPLGGVVLDPFMGAGTVGLVARENGRDYIGIELNHEYAEMARTRIANRGDMPAPVDPAQEVLFQ